MAAIIDERGVQRYGTGSGPADTPGASASGQVGSPVFRGPRAFFDEWHRQAHEDAARAQYPAPPAPPAPPAGAPGANHGSIAGRLRPDSAANPARTRILGVDGWRSRGGRYLRRRGTASPRRRMPSRTSTRTRIARPEPRSSGGKVTTAISGLRGAGALPRRVLGAGPVAMMKNILVVEDEPEIARVIRDYLQAAGFTVSVAADGESALQSARVSRPDLVVLDLGLPGRDGLDVTRELRRTSDVPIVVVTARGDEADRIVGLELGADDYVVKPFSPKELVARVRALFRRVDGRDEPGDVIRVADLEIDIPRMRVTVDGRAVELTASEFQLLAAMAREPGRVFTRGQLLDVLHGVAFESYERAIDAHVKNLRRKIEPEPGETRYVQTVYGVGYRFAG